MHRPVGRVSTAILVTNGSPSSAGDRSEAVSFSFYGFSFFRFGSGRSSERAEFLGIWSTWAAFSVPIPISRMF